MTATVTGVGGFTTQIQSLTTHTNAGTYSDTLTFAGNGNFKAASKVLTSTILQASVTITLTGYSVIVDGLRIQQQARQRVSWAKVSAA